MNYTSLVSKKKQYKYSVNIHFDLQNENRIAEFIPNMTTIEIIKDYLGGIIRNNTETHSRILYGSYGTGKSHLLTVLSAILSHVNVSGKGFKSFDKLVSKYDKALAEDIRKYVKEGKPYIVVPVHSDFSDFGKCISFSMKKEIEKKGYKICFNGFFDEALQLVEKWIEGEESSERLKSECEKQGVSVDEIRKGLSTYDISYEDVFNAIYSGMTYGASFNSTSGSLIDNLNLANELIHDNYQGIVFVFDEFGRYVEDYGKQIKVKEVQDFAEYCDHTDFDNYLILVSHKQLSLYTEGMSKSVSNEWKKIEGRFKATSINVKYDQCLSLIGHIIPKTKHWSAYKKKYISELNDLYNQAWDFKGFMLPPEIEGGNPFENGFPLYPVALFALDRLSKKVAQNERTFFTYLAGDEENALFGQLKSYPLDEFHFVGIDSIYDYFELNVKTFKTDEAYAVYKKLQCALDKLGGENNRYQTAVLKAMAAINIIGDMDVLAAEKTTLINTIDGDVNLISAAIDDLEQKKVIKYMRQYGYYDFFDSSIFDLDSMIEEKLSGISNDTVVNILNEKFAGFVFYPYRYNEKYHINRVWIPVFAQTADLTKKSFKNSLQKYYDGAAIFVMDAQAGDMDALDVSCLPDRSILLLYADMPTLLLEVKRYIAIQYFYSIKDDLAKDDPTVVGELELYLSEQEAIVNEHIKKWKSLYQNTVNVIAKDGMVPISNESGLTEYFSEIMEESFDKTPIINNDLLNKNILSGAIKQARKKALHSLMNNSDIYEECSFLSPEYNILRSTISKNGIDDFFEFDDERINRFSDGIASGTPVLHAIKNTLQSAESKHLPLSELYDVLKSEPFGLRDGSIPVLIAYALRDYQNVSLYFHGTEHSYNEEEIVKALAEHENYTLYLCNWNETQALYIEALEDIFEKYLPSGGGLNRLENLFKAMNSHYGSISKSARTTELYVSQSSKKYRDIMNLSYKDYNKFFFEALPKINKDIQYLAAQIGNIKCELESVEQKQFGMAKRIVRQVFDISEIEELIPSLEALYKTSWSEKKAKAFDYTTNAVLEIVSRANKLNENELISELVKAITTFEISYWTDSTAKDFEEKLRDSVNKLNGYCVEEQLQDGEIKVTIESNDSEPIISQFNDDEMTVAGKMMHNKLRATIDNFGGSISYEEKVAIMVSLLKETLR